MGIIIGETKLTGINEIDVELVVKKWNHLWFISEWRENHSSREYRLIKYVRKDSPMTALKTTISQAQANELIERLGLESYQGAFKSGFSWRTKKDHNFLFSNNDMGIIGYFQ